MNRSEEKVKHQRIVWWSKVTIAVASLTTIVLLGQIHWSVAVVISIIATAAVAFSMLEDSAKKLREIEWEEENEAEEEEMRRRENEPSKNVREDDTYHEQGCSEVH